MSAKLKRPSEQTQVGEAAGRRSKRRWHRVLASGLVTLLTSWVIIFCMPQIIDVVRAYNFHAPEKIVAIDKRLDLTARGTNIFYATNPQINQKAEFNANCKTQERTTAILGCFYKDKIFLYDLQNAELDGTLEVTAAHEMLHAAYQRLTILERWQVDRMIVAAYQHVKDEPTIKQLMAYYTQAEPGAEVDELHSILGTVIAKLTPELEEYYARYFENRASVVALNEKYNQVFERIRVQTEALQTKLAAAEPEIATLLAQYDRDRVQLEYDIDTFNAKVSARAFSSQAAVNNERAVLLQRVNQLNTRRDIINAKVAQYNADVAELNKISLHTNELYQSMNGAEATETLQY